jgi:hypothetical protein
VNSQDTQLKWNDKYRSCVSAIGFSPDDGHVVPETCREYRLINIFEKLSASSWFSICKLMQDPRSTKL